MAVAYPLNIDTVMLEKSRSMTPTFKLLEPNSGPAYVKKISKDTPITYSVVFRFNPEDANIFMTWYFREDYCNQGRTKFILPIKTEFGLLDHECQFIPDSLVDLSQSQGVFEYSASILVRKLPIPQWELDSYELKNSSLWAYRSAFDIAINKTWPA